MAKVPVTEESKNRFYYKYYEKMEIENLTADQFQAIQNSKGSLEDAVSIHDRNRYLDSGVIPETGYYPLKEGGLLVAGNIPMPDVTSDMLYWWYAWHGLEPLRYAIWNPEDHYDVKINDEGRVRSLDPTIPIPEKTWGATHVVTEALAPGQPDEIIIEFENPEKMGFDMSKVGTDDCEFLIAANGTMGAMKIPAVVFEFAKKINGIMTFSARFYIGYRIIDGTAKYMLPPDLKLPEEVAVALIGHNIKEFSHLGKVLPLVYAEEKDNWE